MKSQLLNINHLHNSTEPPGPAQSLGFCDVKGLNQLCPSQSKLKTERKAITLFSVTSEIILDPLGPNPPCRPISIKPTCNHFNTDFVHRQWQEIERLLFEEELEATLNPLNNHSPDGYSRRLKITL